jgi:hypothetical protein
MKRSASLAILLLVTLAGCAASGDGGNTTATNMDVDAPLASEGDIRGGAPDNATLPEEGKADATYPARFSLVESQSPVQSQGSRGVCSIFATVALMEHLYILEGSNTMPDFSEQYLQWSVKNEVGDFAQTEGSNASSNLEAISRFGIPVESAWPYESQPWSASNDPACTGGESLPTRCYTNGEPPESARTGMLWRLPEGRWVNSSPRSIKAHMTTEHTAVSVGMTFFYQSWNHRRSMLPTNQDYWRQGYVTYPNAKDREISLVKRAGHAIVLVGWDDELEVQSRDETGALLTNADGTPKMERGFFLFKNSWGTGSFGVNNPLGDGYGWISYRYIQEYGSVYVSGIPEGMTPVTAEICDNGSDDDRDRLADCDDTDCSAAPACMMSGGTTMYTAPMAVSIPDDDATGAASTIDVPDTGNVLGITVDVDVTHTYRGDLKVVLTHDGTEAVLMDNEGGSADDIRQSFTTTAFDGRDSTGIWTLTVIDSAAQDTGSLNSWTLTIAR